MKSRIVFFIDKYKSLNERIKVIFWFVVASFFSKGVISLTTPLFTRVLTVEEYGVFSTFVSWNSIFILFTTLSLSVGYVSVKLSKNETIMDEVIASVQSLVSIISFIFLIIVIIFQNFVSNVLDLPVHIIILMFFSYIFSCSFSLKTLNDKFKNKYLLFLIVTILQSIFSPAIILFIILKSSMNGAYIQIVLSIIITIIVNLPFYFYNYWKVKSFGKISLIKEAFSFNVVLLPHYLSTIILISADRIVIQYVCGYEKTAIYSLVYTISSLLSVFISPLYSSIQPTFYKWLKNNQESKISKLYIKLWIYLAITLNVIILFSPEIIKFFAPIEYYESVFILPILMFSTFLSSFYIVFVQIQMFYSKRIMIAISSILIAIFNLLLNIIFVPIYGYIAAAVVTLICYLLYTIFHFYNQSKCTEKPLFSLSNFLLIVILELVFCIMATLSFYFLLLRIVLFIIVGIASTIYIYKSKYFLNEMKNNSDF